MNNEERRTIVSVTLLLVENRDGVRFCDTVSSMDESQLTVGDLAKFQFHCFHWFAAFHEILVRKLASADEATRNELQKQAEEMKRISERLET